MLRQAQLYIYRKGIRFYITRVYQLRLKHLALLTLRKVTRRVPVKMGRTWGTLALLAVIFTTRNNRVEPQEAKNGAWLPTRSSTALNT